MKTFIYGSALLLAALLSLPATADAFARRSSSTEFGPLQATTAPTNGTNGSAQSVPEPPVLWLMSIGVGVFGAGYAISRFRRQS